jgi:hypothetical protein
MKLLNFIGYVIASALAVLMVFAMIGMFEAKTTGQLMSMFVIFISCPVLSMLVLIDMDTKK